MLNRLSRLPVVRRFVRRAPGSILWATLCNHGVVVALAEGAEETALISLFSGAEPLIAPARVQATAHGDRLIAVHPLPAALFDTARRCRLRVDCGGDTFERRIDIGPGCVSVRFDGVADHYLRGWASALSNERGLRLQLLVDGRPALTGEFDRFRSELMAVSADGGWNGFSMPLPAAALDGKPHDLAIRIGRATRSFGRWSSRPTGHIDHVGPERLTGWYLNAEELDEPALIRLEHEGRTIASCPTGPRSDLKELFGRDHGAFAFVDVPIPDGTEIVTGPPDTGHRLGLVRIEDGSRRAARLREEARQRLVSEGAAASFAARGALRSRIEAARLDESRRHVLEPIATETMVRDPAVARAVIVPARPAVAIVPVYRGLADTRACVNSLLPQLGEGRRAIIVEDSSPDPDLRAYLAALSAEDRPDLVVLRNESNLGFIGTVNRAFSMLRPGEDAVVVNADTILPPDAISRLAAICHRESGIASVTPMSNNATILSFPDPTRPNAPILGRSADAIDAAFRAIGGEPIELPTGIGFCMYLNGEALAEVGLFSPEWGRGYCEEVDWSLRARDLGWRHLAAPDIFVMHEGSVSFGVAERSAILDVNHALLEAKYPEYLGEVHAIIAADPWSRLRAEAAARLLAERYARLTLFVTHGLGGGTKRYIDDLAGLKRDGDHAVAVLVPVSRDIGGLRVRFEFDAGFALEHDPSEIEAVLSVLESAGLTIHLHVNSRLVFPEAFIEALAVSSRPYTVTLHDYQWYCPKVHLIDERSFYCGEPPPDVCQLCVRHYQEHDFGDHNGLIQRDIEGWLAFNARFLRGARRLIAPSLDTARRYEKRLGLTGIDVVPHPEPGAAARPPRPFASERTGPMRIALVGALGFHKGFDLVVRMAEQAERRRLPIFFRFIGYTPDLRRVEHLSNVDVTGAYETIELPGLLRAFDPDFVFLSSVWPETYSYVLSEVWAAGYPVAAFDLGAPAERIRERGGGILLRPSRDASAVLDELLAARADRPMPPPEEPPRWPTFDSYYRTGRSDDRAPSPGAAAPFAP